MLVNLSSRDSSWLVLVSGGIAALITQIANFVFTRSERKIDLGARLRKEFSEEYKTIWDQWAKERDNLQAQIKDAKQENENWRQKYDEISNKYYDLLKRFSDLNLTYATVLAEMKGLQIKSQLQEETLKLYETKMTLYDKDVINLRTAMANHKIACPDVAV